ncbi:nicotinamide mononucleotide transporter [Catalinimonas alkaloidigena]|uniref:nicotinamide riboside transporter PnuC n=1 Tax=Catalinimonas alkaloidigena TaxID=1075417 RepID=UPI0024074855|nr:nicotinamide riboside transporter PnuC [Catalinimonas alkaloidigena]MDF9794764.1 nicotinamide mononucleotide transporter [Catalinimonas alkaloidigena]
MEINYIELLALFFGVLSVWFNTRELVWGWPMGIVGTVLSGILFLEARLYSDLILHIFYVILGFYGWYEWLYGGRNKQELKVGTLGKSRLLFLMILGGLAWAGFGYFFDNYTDADLAYWDAFTTSFSFVGTYMLARKRIENWILWIIVDAVAAGIYMYKELFLLSLLYFLYLGLATYGFINWRKSLLEEKKAAY